AVAVQVGPGSAGRPQPLRQAGLLGHLDKAAAALTVGLVAIEGHPAPTRNQQIGPTIAVVIADRAAVCVEESRRAGIQADLLGHVAKLAFAQVFVQPAAVAFDVVFLGPVVVAAARDEDIEEPIAVIVDQADAAPQRFDNGIVLGLLA